MKHFLIVERQNGGCDYTIGCGTRISQTSAPSLDVLVERMKAAAFDPYSDGEFCDLLATDERELSSVEVYELTEALPTNLPLDGWRSERARLAEEAAVRNKEDKERCEFERLKSKYGEK